MTYVVRGSALMFVKILYRLEDALAGTNSVFIGLAGCAQTFCQQSD